jgi:hypothetical protein
MLERRELMVQTKLQLKNALLAKLIALGVCHVSTNYEYGRFSSERSDGHPIDFFDDYDDQIDVSNDTFKEVLHFLEGLIDKQKTQGELDWNLNSDVFTNQSYTVTPDKPIGWDVALAPVNVAP